MNCCANLFSFLRKFHTVFHSGCTSVHFHQQCTRGPFSPQPIQHLVFPDLFMMATLTSVKWNLLVLICISLMARYADHPIMCVWALWVSSLEECLWKSFARVLIGFFVFLLWSHVCSIYILEIKPLSESHWKIHFPIELVPFSPC